MQLTKFLEGLTILVNHYDNPHGHHIAGEHDQFYVFATDRPLAAEDVARMRELGWFQPELEDDDDYDPGEDWSAFL